MTPTTTTRQSQAQTLSPVRKELELPCRPADAFRMFTQELGQWWPLRSHSLFGEQSRGCAMDLERGGELYEIDPAGARHAWGTIQVWEPPGRLVFTFHPGRDAATAGTVEVRFSPSGSGSRVVLEHSGWELLGERGAELRQGYDQGWGEVFGRLYYEHCRRSSAGGMA
jgi:uncharacterized protein YndB with AHSA1/START domain